MKKFKLYYKTWDTRYPDYKKKEYVLDVISINLEFDEVTIPYKIHKIRTEKIAWKNLEYQKIRSYHGH